MNELILSLMVTVSPVEVFEQILPYRDSRCKKLEYWTNGSMMFDITVDDYKMSGTGLFTDITYESGEHNLVYETPVISNSFKQLIISYSESEVLDVIIRKYKNSSKGQPLWGLEKEVICQKKTK